MEPAAEPAVGVGVGVAVGVGVSVGVGVGAGLPVKSRRGEITHPAITMSNRATARIEARKDWGLYRIDLTIRWMPGPGKLLAATICAVFKPMGQ